jgi:hypothetical protein
MAQEMKIPPNNFNLPHEDDGLCAMICDSCGFAERLSDPEVDSSTKDTEEKRNAIGGRWCNCDLANLRFSPL